MNKERGAWTMASGVHGTRTKEKRDYGNGMGRCKVTVVDRHIVGYKPDEVEGQDPRTWDQRISVVPRVRGKNGFIAFIGFEMGGILVGLW